MTPPPPTEQSLAAELRSSALLLGLLLAVVLAGVGLGLLTGLAS
jgi:predicted tellurium resistance membrane protein TerC